ncbi:MAG: hypothetical protein ACPHUL_00405 [Marinomonas gallaica]
MMTYETLIDGEYVTIEVTENSKGFTRNTCGALGGFGDCEHELDILEYEARNENGELLFNHLTATKYQDLVVKGVIEDE